jgi:hypothetical protein
VVAGLEEEFARPRAQRRRGDVAVAFERGKQDRLHPGVVIAPQLQCALHRQELTELAAAVEDGAVLVRNEPERVRREEHAQGNQGQAEGDA